MKLLSSILVFLSVAQAHDKNKPLCSLRPSPGKCLGSALQWYFDDASNSCRKFASDLCGRNDNSFSSRRKCMERCSYIKAVVGSIPEADRMQNQLSRLNKTGESTLANLALTA
nr:kunitz-type serine protease inhibitor-like isoform X2 [Dermacentor andersoni]